MKTIHIGILLVLALISCQAQDETAEKPDYPVEAFFTISREELLSTLEEYPGNISEKVSHNPDYFLALMHDILSFDKETYLIADKTHSLPSDYEPSDIVSLNTYPLALNRNDLSLRKVCMPDVMAMDTAAENIGLRLVYSSSYRSYQYQKTVYNRHVAQMGREAADRVSARPGTSQHQLGTTIDFGSITDAFGDTPEGRWLFENSWKFGFSLSYPEGYEEITGYMHEIWHYRWIGRPAAAAAALYFDNIQHYFLKYINEYWDFYNQRKR